MGSSSLTVSIRFSQKSPLKSFLFLELCQIASHRILLVNSTNVNYKEFPNFIAFYTFHGKFVRMDEISKQKKNFG